MPTVRTNDTDREHKSGRPTAITSTLAFIVALQISMVGAQSYTSAIMPSADAEQKLDVLAQKLDQLDKSTSVRFETLDKVRAAELSALET